MQNLKLTQHYGTYRLGYAEVGAVVQIPINPGFYSLSTLSNVPYVSVIGSGGNEKTFSWGEVFYVAPGDNARVKNASFHPGEITLNGGSDFAAIPNRVTVPVPLNVIDLPTFSVQAAYPVDTRRAKRAWLYLNATAGVACVCSKRGNVKERAHNTTSNNTPGPGYLFTETIAAGSQILQIALGYASVNVNNDPMALLDTATVALQNLTFDPTINPSYYVLEY